MAAEAWKRALQGAPCHMDTSFGPRGSVCIHRAVFLGLLPPKSSQVACQGGVPVPGVAIVAADRAVAVALSIATPGGREADTRGPVWQAPPPGSPAASPWQVHLPDSPVSARYELISSLVVLLPGLPCPEARATLSCKAHGSPRGETTVASLVRGGTGSERWSVSSEGLPLILRAADFCSCGSDRRRVSRHGVRPVP